MDNMSFMLIETSTWVVVLSIAMLLRGKGLTLSPNLISIPVLAGLISVT